MGLFDFFKRKSEPDYDVTNLSVRDLRKGSFFDYDLSSWEVQEVYEYDWVNGEPSLEYKIRNGKDTYYLSVEEDEELELAITRPIKFTQLGEAVYQELMTGEDPPLRIEYQGVKYHLIEDGAAYFSNKTKNYEPEQMLSWDYEDEEGKRILSIEQWGDKEFTAAVGYYVEEYEISNIIP